MFKPKCLNSCAYDERCAMNSVETIAQFYLENTFRVFQRKLQCVVYENKLDHKLKMKT